VSIIAGGISSVVLIGAVTFAVAAHGQKGKAPAPSKADITAGSKVFMANGCTACHVIGDKGGKTGPELTKIGADKKWPPSKLSAVVRDPKKLNTAAKMPAYGPDKITDKELKTLVAYMQSFK